MNIQELRTQINQIDEQLVALFDARMKVALEIGKYKKANALPVYDPARERAVLDKQMAAVNAEMAPYVQRLYQTLFELSKDYQRQYMENDSEDGHTCANGLD